MQELIKDSGKVIGIDFTDDMLLKTTSAAEIHGFKNVEFKKRDIETDIPIEDNSVDVTGILLSMMINKDLRKEVL